ncbi:hypothetical protein GJ496_005594 [Pomphorhynchus laevis]|nr:hypothetical protein GJ496_005594 [Pomphorhynchus laevis]
MTIVDLSDLSGQIQMLNDLLKLSLDNDQNLRDTCNLAVNIVNPIIISDVYAIVTKMLKHIEFAEAQQQRINVEVQAIPTILYEKNFQTEEFCFSDNKRKNELKRNVHCQTEEIDLNLCKSINRSKHETLIGDLHGRIKQLETFIATLPKSNITETANKRKRKR